MRSPCSCPACGARRSAVHGLARGLSQSLVAVAQGTIRGPRQGIAPAQPVPRGGGGLMPRAVVWQVGGAPALVREPGAPAGCRSSQAVDAAAGSAGSSCGAPRPYRVQDCQPLAGLPGGEPADVDDRRCGSRSGFGDRRRKPRDANANRRSSVRIRWTTGLRYGALGRFSDLGLDHIALFKFTAMFAAASSRPRGSCQALPSKGSHSTPW